MRKLAEDVSVSIYNSLKKYTMSIYNIYLLYIRTELPEFVFMCYVFIYLFLLLLHAVCNKCQIHYGHCSFIQYIM